MIVYRPAQNTIQTLNEEKTELVKYKKTHSRLQDGKRVLERREGGGGADL